ncbi:MAG: hypothetical protein GY760_12435 [Deltaproteobacteria bacterium]|nr:hypothetical protein [Deltaproteobacteria bacterium]
MNFKNGYVQILAFIAVLAFCLTANASDLVGKTPGTFRVSSGSANYSVPIVVPPGIAGEQPSLSINYNSNGANGILGMGFSLDGISAITRSGRTIAQDGIKGGVNYDANDRFQLGGQRLIAISGTYGASGTEYRTEIDMYSKIISYGNQGNGPSYFKVWTKTGMIIEFGNSYDSKIEASGKTAVRLWSVNKVSNKYGTSVRYSYYENNFNGEFYLTKASYANNYVSLTYEDRNDTTLKYEAGSKISSTKRLKYVQTYADYTLVKKYELNYTEQSDLKYSLLTSLQEFDGFGKALPEIKFQWNAFETDKYGEFQLWLRSGIGAHPKNYVTGSDDDGVYSDLIDMNGDGLPDRVGYHNNQTSTPGLHVALNNGHGFGGYVLWLRSGEGAHPDNYLTGSNTNGVYSDLIDMNGDGLPDRVGYYNHKTNTQGLHVALNNSHGFGEFKLWLRSGIGAHPNNYIRGSNTNGIYSDLIDMDGDGLPDRVGYYNHKTNTQGLHVALNNGHGFGEFELWLRSGIGPHPNNYIRGSNSDGVYSDLIDMNGDGLPDRVGYYNHNTNTSGLHVALNNGHGFGEFKLWLLSGLGAYSNNYVKSSNTNGVYSDLIDMNGDGLPDRVGHYNYKTNTSGLHVALNNGHGFGEFELWLRPGTGAHSGNYVTGIDSDGVYSDLIDMNGDGLLDRVGQHNYKTNTSGLHVALNKTKKYLLESITSQINSKTISKMNIEFKLLSDSTFYTKGSYYYKYPNCDFQPSWYIVSSVKVNNGIGGQNTVSYKYGGAKKNVNGRGYLGFQWIEEKEETTGKTKYTKYSQDFPYTGMAVLEMVKLIDGTLISKAENFFHHSNLFNGKVYSPYVYKAVRNNYELTGLINTITTENSFIDSYGNSGRSKVTTSANGLSFIKETNQTYTNDTAKWIIGRATKTSVTYTNSDGVSKTRVSERTYDPNTGAILSETVDSSDPLALLTTYRYDGYGNMKVSTMSGAGVEPRTTTIQTDPTGRFAIKTTNSLGHSETREFDGRFGKITKSTGPNGLPTTWGYDSLGRKIKKTLSDGTVTTWSYLWSYSYGLYKVTEKTSGKPPKILYYDNVDRVIKRETLGFNGRTIYLDSVYDNIGQLTKTSRPYYKYDTIYWNRLYYDILGRKSSIKESTLTGYATTTFSYNGSNVVSENHLSQKKTTTKNIIGQTVRVEEEEGAWINYKYDPFGNLIETNKNYVITTMAYNNRDKKISMNDPDMGTWAYKYNPYGELVEEKSAKGQILKLSYDKLGRLVQKNEAEGISTWEYDTATKGIGKIAEIKRGLEYLKTFTYDNLGRPSTVTTNVDNQSFPTRNYYDSYSRLIKVIQPQNFIIEYLYNANGFLTAIRSPKQQINDYDWKFLKFLLDTANQSVANATAAATKAQQKATYYNSKATYYKGLGSQTPYMPQSLKDELSATSVQLQKAAEVLLEEYATSTKLAEDLKTVSTQLAQQKDIIDQRLDNTNPNGNLSELTRMVNNSSYSYFWIAQDMDASGRLEGFVYGNGLSTEKKYDQATGQLKTIKSDFGFSSDLVRNLEYDYDVINNVKARFDLVQGMTERFSYDSLNRLTESKTEGVINGLPYNKASSYRYNSLGNITYNSNLGYYYYKNSAVNAGPHAITRAGSLTGYKYDSNGNMIEGGGKTIEWTSFNKPKKFTKGTSKVEFIYGPDLARYLKKETKVTGTVKTVYIGKNYEKITEGNKTTSKYFIHADGHLVTIHIKVKENSTQLPDETRYLHYDSLGSIDTITDGRGNVVERQSYEAFGKRREGNWKSSNSVLPAFTNRGYTGHEHIDEIGLIHMNGRVYDPEIGRFLSPDVYIQSTYSTQSYNRYTYVHNNPLKYKDPTGHFLSTIMSFVATYKAFTDDKWQKAINQIGKQMWLSAVNSVLPYTAYHEGKEWGVVLYYTGGLASYTDEGGLGINLGGSIQLGPLPIVINLGFKWQARGQMEGFGGYIGAGIGYKDVSTGYVISYNFNKDITSETFYAGYYQKGIALGISKTYVHGSNMSRQSSWGGYCSLNPGEFVTLNTSENGRPQSVSWQHFGDKQKFTSGLRGRSGFLGENSLHMMFLDTLLIHPTSVVHDFRVRGSKYGFSSWSEFVDLIDFVGSMPVSYFIAGFLAGPQRQNNNIPNFNYTYGATKDGVLNN